MFVNDPPPQLKNPSPRIWTNHRNDQNEFKNRGNVMHVRKRGCLDLFVDIIRSFLEGMVARVQYQGQTSDQLSVTNGAKQCVMAPL